MRAGLVAVAALVVLLVPGLARAAQPIGVEPFILHSSLLDRDFRELLLIPPGGAKDRELLVFLHGYTQPPEDDAAGMIPVLRSLGKRAPAVLLVDDGDLTSWWHDGASGKWGSYVLREAIPTALKRTGADPRRVAIGGISMGGFGSLDLARLAPQQFCAVGAHAPAIFNAAYYNIAGAFDSLAEFKRHDLLSLAAKRRLYRVPVWIDVGQVDDLRSAATVFAGSLRRHGTDVTFRLVPGGHSGWAGRMPTYLRWYVRACS